MKVIPIYDWFCPSRVNIVKETINCYLCTRETRETSLSGKKYCEQNKTWLKIIFAYNNIQYIEFD